MQTQHLQYLVEIERVRSISQAASNLCLGQPNLSRILREIEASVGFPIFQRSSRGVLPTERGGVFLRHAHNILRELEAIEVLGPRYSYGDRFRICIPRSASYFQRIADYLAALPQEHPIDAVIRECHAKSALELLASGAVELGIIRFRAEYHNYFAEQIRCGGLQAKALDGCCYSVLMRQAHPLAAKGEIYSKDLVAFPEIVHSDSYFLPKLQEQQRVNRVYTVDRMARLTLLQSAQNYYTWAAPLGAQLLHRWDLVQRPCMDRQDQYEHLLVYNPNHCMSQVEAGFLRGLT